MSNVRQLKLYNTLSRRKEIFRSLHKRRVGLYTCGPTVYNYAHIGNLRTYIFEDVLRRTLEHFGYRVKQVMNITDVGHLTSDADQGEDKLERGARRERKSVWDITKFYTEAFLSDIGRLGIKKAQKLIPATSEVKEQIRIIQRLFKNGYAYETFQAVYFDVLKFGAATYTKLSKQKIDRLIIGARGKVVVDSKKKNPYDFALWFKAVGRFENHVMRWSSPWGEGFPGWHIECSAISSKYLGQPFDIHAGGVDHINIHHTNEIAQSEGAFGKPLARVWMHGEFLLVDNAKMAKSEGNFLTLNLLIKKGFNPLAYRYLILTSHYRSKLNFTWESLLAVQNSLERLYDFVRDLKSAPLLDQSAKRSKSETAFKKSFDNALFNDLDTPKALAVMWGLIHTYNKNPRQFDARAILKLLYQFDEVLGLGLKSIKVGEISQKILALAKKREVYRKNRQWREADKIRGKINTFGYTIEDTLGGQIIRKQ